MGRKMGEIAYMAPRDRGLPRVPVTWLLAFFLAAVGAPAFAQDQVADCAPVIARVVALQGTVEVQRAGIGSWLSVRRLDASICAGDKLRTAPSSRAALFVQPETLVRLDQNTTLTLQQSTDEISIEFSTDDVSRVGCTGQTCGAGYFITRFPKKFRVKSPHMNAAVEGTEFMVEMSSEATKLTVLEGKVSSQSTATGDSQVVAAGQSLASGQPGPGAITTVLKPQDAVQWVLRYPPISDAGEPSNGSGIARAESNLQVGRVGVALAEIDGALTRNPGDANALALRSVIQLAKNDKAAAMESAQAATAGEPGNYRAWLALSYSQQASFELKKALQSARQAQKLNVDSSLLQARVAELELSLGNRESAEQAARAAVTANPAEGAGYTILGFVHLAEIDTKAARSVFSSAIERDSFDALPRLGLGLALIRDGDFDQGREQLEIAVALDPGNSLLRSYVGKAYYEENTRERDELAATQFGLARNLDPKDPTPHFYEAILLQSQNRPVESLAQLEAARKNNENRAVYRSRFYLDDDAAAQGATVAAVYGSLGFEKLAIIESTRALFDNAGSHSAHRELASAYANIPRHDIARVSEALQAQIRQPVSVAPVNPLLTTDSLLVLRDAGPTYVGTHDFNRLFNQNQFEVTAEALAGSHDSWGGQIQLSGLEERLAYSIGAIDYQTDGFIENDAAEKSIYDLFAQAQVTGQSTIQVNARRSDFSVGQTFSPFAESAEQTTISETSDTLRLSGHLEPSPSLDWAWSAVYEDRQRELSTFPDDFVFTGVDAETAAFELQNLLRIGSLQLVSGISYVDEDDTFLEGITVSADTASIYSYGQWRSNSANVGIQAGLAADWFRLENSAFENEIRKDRIHPKVGLFWSPRPGTTIRAAAFSSLLRPLIRNQTLEPTQVAGFNQFFTGFQQFFGDPMGTESNRAAIGVDQLISESTFCGIELTKRNLEVPQLTQGTDFEWNELTASLYLYKTFDLRNGGDRSASWQAAFSMEADFERIDRMQLDTGLEGILDVDTIRAPIGLRLFNERGVTIRMATTYVEQGGDYLLFIGEPIVPKQDNGWIVDVAFEYRLPRRTGIIILGANNLFDEFVDVVETDPMNPRIAIRRLAFLKVRVSF
jgi:Tfp pilus assembly protein PilF